MRFIFLILSITFLFMSCFESKKTFLEANEQIKLSLEKDTEAGQFFKNGDILDAYKSAKESETSLKRYFKLKKEEHAFYSSFNREPPMILGYIAYEKGNWEEAAYYLKLVGWGAGFEYYLYFLCLKELDQVSKPENLQFLKDIAVIKYKDFEGIQGFARYHYELARYTYEVLKKSQYALEVLEAGIIIWHRVENNGWKNLNHVEDFENYPYKDTIRTHFPNIYNTDLKCSLEDLENLRDSILESMK